MVHAHETPVLGIRLDFGHPTCSLVYTGDTVSNEQTATFAAGCDLLVHEANFSETLHPDINAVDYGHSTARHVGRTAAQANCRLLALVHLHFEYEKQEEIVRAEAAQEFDGPVIVPPDGTVIFL